MAMKTTEPFTAEEAKEYLDYDPDTGIFRWKVNAGRHGRIKAGSVAGSYKSSKEGYGTIRLFNTSTRTSRVAWLLMTGEWPKEQIDHVNRNTSDDRWCNLREATPAQNKANCGMNSNNTSGYKGVYFDRQRGHWRAKAKVNGKRRWLGRFATKEQAYAAYCEQHHRNYGEFASFGD